MKSIIYKVSESLVKRISSMKSLTWTETQFKCMNEMLMMEISVAYDKRDTVLIERIKAAIRYLRKRNRRHQIAQDAQGEAISPQS